MRLTSLLILLGFLASCSAPVKSVAERGDEVVRYSVSMKDDAFVVDVFVEKLPASVSEFHFTKVAPGTYRNLDFGRLVKEFNAYDEHGGRLKTTRVDSNIYALEMPEKIRRISYVIDDSFGAVNIFPMGGTGIEEEMALINTFGVFGYFAGLEGEPVSLRMKQDEDWVIGTSLVKDGGKYIAKNYTEFADAPILTGELTKVHTNVGGIEVGIYVYSSTGVFTADSILAAATGILTAAREFIGFNAADNYNFLMVFLDGETMNANGFNGYGALEHTTSSAYVLPEQNITLKQVVDIMAHEFFHVVTPLNIHSDVIANFNFSKPQPTRHLWMFEGVTEWASHIMQLRKGMISLEQYLGTVSQKENMNQNRFKPSYSLEDVGLNSYDGAEGAAQYQNIYMKGANVAGLMDIRLLELTDGKRGLREVIYDLSQEYGKHKYFKDEEFFDIFVDHAEPEIKDFVDRYIRDGQALPYKEYYGKLGVNFHTEPRPAGTPDLGYGLKLNEKREIVISSVSESVASMGLEKEDILLEVNEKTFTLQEINGIFQGIISKGIGTEYSYKVKRGEEEKTIALKIVEGTQRFTFTVNKAPSPEQQKLRAAWLKNMKLN